jgi:hypothetical protein
MKIANIQYKTCLLQIMREKSLFKPFFLTQNIMYSGFRASLDYKKMVFIFHNLELNF